MSISNQNKYAIALHTSTPQLGIAINNYAGDRRDRLWDLGRGLASELHQYLQEIIAPQTWQDLKFMAVAKGPGGFTGTRVGVVTARTIAQQLNIPLFGISNLAAVAAAQNDGSADLLAVEMDARREQLFVGIYQLDSQGNLQTYLEDSLMTVQAWQDTLGDLNSSYQLIKAEENIAATVTNVLDLAHVSWQKGTVSHWSAVVPFYGQHPVNN
ncbi:tRNA (adenosine(37)-N6)-threonylcarbamoyltransferase complex dimerization subunit type 1 TsaB [Waterburya agarophytonicola K14]|uniref:tRNA (Adenosine(37)-N6)-threonylcarbamoyltransferase complex dimerization subunit type 1 TsaB n=1 Tax=Waterburya agarophytonicola KI4 TaxID=2874699 RepID=A0A964BL37_9CYAN|nr:tRNA (adenosine(37)-N6)-threonylcarbamoyltransferase complex dimerization subunit type 1 TsaB [Waterburya agarophytonicola]MCC0175380.1 tRNA (adenosine(37)-N6)-threonylcarbamoyltransferase complex dimerization subunit type 1 TsaB [Waterburya agarophytonicola KI4]